MKKTSKIMKKRKQTNEKEIQTKQMKKTSKIMKKNTNKPMKKKCKQNK